MNDILKALQAIDAIESKKVLTESHIDECGFGDAVAAEPINQGNPVTASVTLNASGMDHVADLMKILQQAGLNQAGPVTSLTPPMRTDMENFRDKIAGLEGPPSAPKEQYFDVEDVTGAGDDLHKDKHPSDIRVKDASAFENEVNEWDRDPGIEDAERDESLESVISQAMPEYDFTPVDHETAMEIAKRSSEMSSKSGSVDIDNTEEFYNYLERRGLIIDSEVTEWDNEPEEDYGDHLDLIKRLAGGLNKEKKMYKAAQPGDNAMAAESEDNNKKSSQDKNSVRESIKERLQKALDSKK